MRPKSSWSNRTKIPARIVAEHRIFDDDGIVAFPHQIVFLLLERDGDIDLTHNAQEHGTSVRGEPRNEVAAECRELELPVDDERGHAGTAYPLREFPLRRRSPRSLRQTRDRLRYLGRRYVFALPAKVSPVRSTK